MIYHPVFAMTLSDNTKEVDSPRFNLLSTFEYVSLRAVSCENQANLKNRSTTPVMNFDQILVMHRH